LEGSHAEQKQRNLESSKHFNGSGQAQVLSRNGSVSSLLGMEPNHYSKPLTGTKYSLEELCVIQALLDRVVECGEVAAQELHQCAEGVYLTKGPMVTMDENGQVILDASPSAVITAIEAGFLPIDPMSNSPSVHHLDSMYSHAKTGLLPFQSEPPPYPLFLQAPHFLDALLNLADSLFALPRDQRTVELRRQLQILEVTWLPSNVIYVPVTRIQHRIWRIVADESIAISTKERVPCIVTLEVIDYYPYNNSCTSNRNRSFSSTSSGFQDWMMRDEGPPDERDVVNTWRTARRNPRRFETLLDKVTSFTRDTARSAHETLQKLQHRSLMSRSEDGNEEEAEEMVNLTFSLPQSALTPTKGATPPTAAMGQWSSPLSSISPSKVRGLQGGLSWRRRERILANGDDTLTKDDDQQVMDALMTIRRKMELRQEENGTFLSTNDKAGTYGTTQKQPLRPPQVVFKESWSTKESRLRAKSVYGSHPNWRLLPILIKSNDDLRQEQLASQLIYRMASILAHERVPVWLCPYEIVALTDRGGIIEAIPDTISLDSLKRNDPNFSTLLQFFETHFDGEALLDARANFVESLAGYSIVSFLLQIKDRHNGNILLDNRGHLIHIDFGFFFLSSPGKNSGFESAPFKLTTDFVDLMGGPHSHVFRMFRELCCRTFLALRKHCLEITLLVEMLMVGNEDLHCFCNKPEEAVRGLRERFRLDWNDRACTDYVNTLIDESMENWRTRWYDRYQRFCVGVL
jgi:phosphatidylinositol 4-kinase B